MRIPLALAALVLLAAAAHAKEPTAAELLRRAKAGESVIGDVDTTRSPELKPIRNIIGVAVGERLVFLESGYYFGPRATYGVFFGFAGMTISSDYVYGALDVYHAGLAQKIDDRASVGLGFTYEHAAVDVGYARDSASKFGPHGWFEYGNRYGLAARLQGGPEGAAVGVVYRSH